MFTAIRVIIFSFSLPLLLTGCLYSNTVSPYSTEFNNTSVGTKRCIINDYRVKEPFTGLNMTAEWSNGFILKEAKKAGINNIYYIDVKTLSIFFETFKQETLIVYGD